MANKDKCANIPVSKQNFEYFSILTIQLIYTINLYISVYIDPRYILVIVNLLLSAEVRRLLLSLSLLLLLFLLFLWLFF